MSVSGLPDIQWLVAEVQPSTDPVHWGTAGEIQPVNDLGQAEAVTPEAEPDVVRAYRICLSPRPNQNRPITAGSYYVGAYQLSSGTY
jgi:hypothetical protein